MKAIVSAALLACAIAAPCAVARAEDVVAVVSVRSPVTAMRPAEVADIFLGKASRFPDGTQAMPIDLAEESAVREKFYAAYAGKSPAQVKAHWARIIFTGRGQPPRQVNNGLEARKAVAENPHAIGYMDSRLVDSSVRVVALR